MSVVRYVALVLLTALLAVACSSDSEAAFAADVCVPFDDVLDRLVADDDLKTVEVQAIIDRLPEADASAIEEVIFGSVENIPEIVRASDSLEARSTKQCGYPLLRVLLHMTINCAITRIPGNCVDARLAPNDIPTLQEQLQAIAA